MTVSRPPVSASLDVARERLYNQQRWLSAAGLLSRPEEAHPWSSDCPVSDCPGPMVCFQDNGNELLRCMAVGGCGFCGDALGLAALLSGTDDHIEAAARLPDVFGSASSETEALFIRRESRRLWLTQSWPRLWTAALGRERDRRRCCYVGLHEPSHVTLAEWDLYGGRPVGLFTREEIVDILSTLGDKEDSIVTSEWTHAFAAPLSDLPGRTSGLCLFPVQEEEETPTTLWLSFLEDDSDERSRLSLSPGRIRGVVCCPQGLSLPPQRRTVRPGAIDVLLLLDVRRAVNTQFAAVAGAVAEGRGRRKKRRPLERDHSVYVPVVGTDPLSLSLDPQLFGCSRVVVVAFRPSALEVLVSGEDPSFFSLAGLFRHARALDAPIALLHDKEEDRLLPDTRSLIRQAERQAMEWPSLLDAVLCRVPGQWVIPFLSACGLSRSEMLRFAAGSDPSLTGRLTAGLLRPTSQYEEETTGVTTTSGLSLFEGRPTRGEETGWYVASTSSKSRITTSSVLNVTVRVEESVLLYESGPLYYRGKVYTGRVGCRGVPFCLSNNCPDPLKRLSVLLGRLGFSLRYDERHVKDGPDFWRLVLSLQSLPAVPPETLLGGSTKSALFGRQPRHGMVRLPRWLTCQGEESANEEDGLLSYLPEAVTLTFDPPFYSSPGRLPTPSEMRRLFTEDSSPKVGNFIHLLAWTAASVSCRSEDTPRGQKTSEEPVLPRAGLRGKKGALLLARSSDLWLTGVLSAAGFASYESVCSEEEKTSLESLTGLPSVSFCKSSADLEACLASKRRHACVSVGRAEKEDDEEAEVLMQLSVLDSVCRCADGVEDDRTPAHALLRHSGPSDSRRDNCLADPTFAGELFGRLFQEYVSDLVGRRGFKDERHDRLLWDSRHPYRSLYEDVLVFIQRLSVEEDERVKGPRLSWSRPEDSYRRGDVPSEGLQSLADLLHGLCHRGRLAILDADQGPQGDKRSKKDRDRLWASACARPDGDRAVLEDDGRVLWLNVDRIDDNILARPARSNLRLGHDRLLRLLTTLKRSPRGESQRGRGREKARWLSLDALWLRRGRAPLRNFVTGV